MHGINYVHKNSLCRSLRAPCAYCGLPETLNQSPQKPEKNQGKSGSFSLLDALCVLLVMLIAFPSLLLQLIDREGEKSPLFLLLFFSDPDLSDIFHRSCVLVTLTDLLKRQHRIYILQLKWKKKKKEIH